ncbi:DUF4363 family protein [Irregularibacter muris]|uniref:DUF4363 family protein n=1 Tax=Irregularibacter muris TaxID=1796619 RepID=A0AAE3KZ64_9FIRM|nr:DUF4363 family protein [Irregularibacter muris]MCR1897752.1 DUF4363 family protein [Irregularibacter muris]
MRILWISLSILCIFVILSVYFSYSMEKNSEEMLVIINDLEKKVVKENWQGAKKVFDKLQAKWDKISPLWRMFIDHDEMDKLEISLNKVKELIKVENKDLSRVEVSLIRFLVRDIYLKEKLTLENIF